MDASHVAHDQPVTDPAPTVACLRCRGQKLRCDRAVPSCTRCRKQRATCQYPSPPDRKRKAQRAASRQKTPPSDPLDLAVPPPAPPPPAPSTPPPPPSAPPSKRPRHDDPTPTRPFSLPRDDDPEPADLPSTELGLFLLEVYFKRIYNSTLLFHKTIAFQLYAQDAIPPFLLRAIFALAAIFTQPVTSPHAALIRPVPVPALHECAWSWARAASREVLSRADDPHLLHVQALQVLQFYYYAVGETRRSLVHSSLAYRLAQVLGYDRLDGRGGNGERDGDGEPGFHVEMRRRSFWASWCTFCIGIQQWDSPRVCERVAGLPLPAKYEKGGTTMGVDLRPGQSMDGEWMLGEGEVPNHEVAGTSSCALLAELVKILGIWTKVQTFITNASRCSATQRIEEVDKLARLFDQVQSSLQIPVDDVCARAKFYDEPPELLVSVCSLFHVGQLLMHASMVPIFSGRPAELSTSKESIRRSADNVRQHATSFIALLRQAFAKDLDITRLWPFSGYAAFVVASVSLVYRGIMQSTKSADQCLQVPGLDPDDFRLNQTVLEILSIYWKPLRKWATKLSEAVEADCPNKANWITSPTYPWDNDRCSTSLEDHGDLASASAASNVNRPFIHATYVDSPLSERGSGSGSGSYDTCLASQQGFVEQQNLPQTTMSANVAVPLVLDPAQPAALEDVLMISNCGSVSEPRWWNGSPVFYAWEQMMASTAAFQEGSTL